MREYNTNVILNIYQQFKENRVLELDNNNSTNFLELVYFLIRHRIRSFIIDDYIVSISDKTSLLEALYYQIGLVDMYDLNWDALQEALENYVKNNGCGIVFIFKNGSALKLLLQEEFEVLEEIITGLSNDLGIKSGIILG